MSLRVQCVTRPNFLGAALRIGGAGVQTYSDAGGKFGSTGNYTSRVGIQRR
jgi:hypothetical protein